MTKASPPALPPPSRTEFLAVITPQGTLTYAELLGEEDGLCTLMGFESSLFSVSELSVDAVRRNRRYDHFTRAYSEARATTVDLLPEATLLTADQLDRIGRTPVRQYQRWLNVHAGHSTDGEIAADAKVIRNAYMEISRRPCLTVAQMIDKELTPRVRDHLIQAILENIVAIVPVMQRYDMSFGTPRSEWLRVHNDAESGYRVTLGAFSLDAAVSLESSHNAYIRGGVLAALEMGFGVRRSHDPSPAAAQDVLHGDRLIGAFFAPDATWQASPDSFHLLTEAWAYSNRGEYAYSTLMMTLLYMRAPRIPDVDAAVRAAEQRLKTALDRGLGRLQDDLTEVENRDIARDAEQDRLHDQTRGDLLGRIEAIAGQIAAAHAAASRAEQRASDAEEAASRAEHRAIAAETTAADALQELAVLRAELAALRRAPDQLAPTSPVPATEPAPPTSVSAWWLLAAPASLLVAGLIGWNLP